MNLPGSKIRRSLYVQASSKSKESLTSKELDDIIYTKISDYIGGPQMNRFEKVYNQGKITVTEIWRDTETGVLYLFHKDGYAGGLTPLLDKDGKPVVELGK